jgi:hypothetical protein
MISMPYSLFKMLIVCMASICILCLVGNYACVLAGKAPPPDAALLVHTIIGSMLGLLIVPKAKDAPEQPLASGVAAAGESS